MSRPRSDRRRLGRCRIGTDRHRDGSRWKARPDSRASAADRESLDGPVCSDRDRHVAETVIALEAGRESRAKCRFVADLGTNTVLPARSRLIDGSTGGYPAASSIRSGNWIAIESRADRTSEAISPVAASRLISKTSRATSSPIRRPISAATALTTTAPRTYVAVAWWTSGVSSMIVACSRPAAFSQPATTASPANVPTPTGAPRVLTARYPNATVVVTMPAISANPSILISAVSVHSETAVCKTTTPVTIHPPVPG